MDEAQARESVKASLKGKFQKKQCFASLVAFLGFFRSFSGCLSAYGNVDRRGVCSTPWSGLVYDRMFFPMDADGQIGGKCRRHLLLCGTFRPTLLCNRHGSRNTRPLGISRARSPSRGGAPVQRRGGASFGTQACRWKEFVGRHVIDWAGKRAGCAIGTVIAQQLIAGGEGELLYGFSWRDHMHACCLFAYFFIANCYRIFLIRKFGLTFDESEYSPGRAE